MTRKRVEGALSRSRLGEGPEGDLDLVAGVARFLEAAPYPELQDVLALRGEARVDAILVPVGELDVELRTPMRQALAYHVLPHRVVSKPVEGFAHPGRSQGLLVKLHAREHALVLALVGAGPL